MRESRKLIGINAIFLNISLQEISLKIIEIAAHTLGDHLDQQITAHQEHTHAEVALTTLPWIDYHVPHTAIWVNGINRWIADHLWQLSIAVNHGDVRLIFHMSNHHVAIVNVTDHIAIAQNYIFFLGIREEPHDGFQRFNPAVVDQGFVAKRRKHKQAGALARQVPRLP